MYYDNSGGHSSQNNSPAYADTVNYEFRDEAYAEAFAELNK
jgi:hypothetical protein